MSVILSKKLKTSFCYSHFSWGSVNLFLNATSRYHTDFTKSFFPENLKLSNPLLQGCISYSIRFSYFRYRGFWGYWGFVRLSGYFKNKTYIFNQFLCHSLELLYSYNVFLGFLGPICTKNLILDNECIPIYKKRYWYT